MSDKSDKSELVLLSNEFLLDAYAGAMLMTIPAARTPKDDIISIDQAWKDAHDLADEILRRMKEAEAIRYMEKIQKEGD